MKKKGFNFLIKVIAAMIVAFIVLNVLCIFYYNVPVHSLSKTLSTDYVWQKEKFYSRGTEGFALGVIDENGFNNLQTYKKGDIDLLIMGSSHMGAFNVAQDKNVASLLNQKFKTANLDINVYNIGVAGHVLERCLNNLDNAVDEFAPQKYVVIETASVVPDAITLQQAIDGTLTPIESHNSSIMNFLQKLPYLRLLYSQLKNIVKENNADEAPTQSNDGIGNDKTELYSNLDRLMNQSIKKCKETDVHVIIFYNCEILIDEMGNVVDRNDIKEVTAFKEVCDKNGVIFVDMYDAFASRYEKTKKLPRGFANTQAGSGHINETGHQVIADEIYAIINK